MCQRPSNGKIPNQQGLVLKHKTLCLALILLPIPATGLRNVTGLVPFVDATERAAHVPKRRAQGEDEALAGFPALRKSSSFRGAAVSTGNTFAACQDDLEREK